MGNKRTAINAATPARLAHGVPFMYRCSDDMVSHLRKLSRLGRGTPGHQSWPACPPSIQKRDAISHCDTTWLAMDPNSDLTAPRAKQRGDIKRTYALATTSAEGTAWVQACLVRIAVGSRIDTVKPERLKPRLRLTTAPRRSRSTVRSAPTSRSPNHVLSEP
jgi:hypothetical protein